VANIITGSMHFDGQVKWDEVYDNATDATHFRQAYQKALLAKEAIPEAFIHKAILLNMEDLIANTPDTQFKDDQASNESYGYEPFIFYALDNPSMMQLLIKKGVEVNGRNWFGKTALMYTAQWNLMDAAALLLKNRAEVNAVTPVADPGNCENPAITGRTALLYAAENASAPLIELLIKSGADTKTKNSVGKDFQYYMALNKMLTNEERVRIIKTLRQ
ncbi:MAG TPA: ankyrin repeat domain-containing protein, partial [Rickettsiales bacterium]|nr:ankyrin repeat domain-containing protein [Rickettsiales bacterium]